MQLYANVPYIRIGISLFTIVFHMNLLIRAFYETRYLIAAILIIPVGAISVALIKFVHIAVIKVRINGLALEIDTLFRTERFNLGDIYIEGGAIRTVGGKKFIFKKSKAANLLKELS